MKKNGVFFFCIVFCLTACQPQAKSQIELKPAPAVVKEVKTTAQSDRIMEEFNRLMAKNPRENELLDFMVSKISEVPQVYADEMILGYERIQNSSYRSRHEFMMRDELQEVCLSNFDFGGVPEDLSVIRDVGLRIYLEEIKQTGYRIVLKDGKYLPEIDYGFYKQFKEYASPQIQLYLHLMTTRKERFYTADGTMPATWDEVFERILAFENFLIQYPDSKKKDVIWLNYEYYTKIYLFGMEKAPAFKQSTGKLDNWLKVSYENVYLGNTESAFIKQFKTYIRVLEEDSYQLTESVDKQRNTVLFNLDMQLIY